MLSTKVSELKLVRYENQSRIQNTGAFCENSLQLKTFIFVKRSILDVLQISEYTSKNDE